MISFYPRFFFNFFEDFFLLHFFFLHTFFFNLTFFNFVGDFFFFFFYTFSKFLDLGGSEWHYSYRSSAKRELVLYRFSL